MSDTNAVAFRELVSARSGHFLLESGHHSGLWLDLDSLFASPRRIEPFVAKLANALRGHDIEGVCGPLVGGAFLAQLVAGALGIEFSFTERVMPASDGNLYQARYLLPPPLASRVINKRLAMVDDVMSAGSALRGTYAELEAHGAVPVVAGALLVLGAKGADFFNERGVPVQAVARDDFELWLPSNCPLCAARISLEQVSAPAG